ncbi:transcription factor HBP-1b(c38)-like [Rutidosis leptorrhynchoides]|uniref:transcription factor HBP-1b(c38)-like n=1 Tax=Rutidosis leptorrhynchoides TaxID=125765 RepID=UPI003A9A144F
MRDIIVSPNRAPPIGVIQRGTRSEIVHASLHSSDLWRHCKIGEGKINDPNDGEADVELPPEILLQTDGNSFENYTTKIMKAAKKREHVPLDNFQQPAKDVVDAGSDLSEKLKLKRAKSAESSKRTRDRQKAYIEQIELLMQQQKKQIESLIEAQNEVSVDSKADITNFGRFYRDWSYKFDNLIASLQRQIYVNSNPDHISPVIQIILNHIDLSNQQLEKIELLKVQTIEQEKTITYQLNTLKDEISGLFAGSKFVDRGDHEAMSNFKNNMFEQIGRLSAMAIYLTQADTLRTITYKKLQTVLTLTQIGIAFITVHKHVKRLHTWTNLWESKPNGPNV